MDRLRNRLAFWKSIRASPTVLKWIEYGYDIPLSSIPPTWFKRNGPGAKEFDFFLDDMLPKLVEMGAVQKVSEQPYGVSPLDVVPKPQAGKYRLILDLRFLNKHLHEFSFSMETLHRMRNLFQKGDLMFNLDLENGYYHVVVRPEDRKYLGFKWRNQFYVFAVLPFGLSSAPIAFTKVMKQLANHWRRNGWRLLFYLDDWCFMCRDQEVACIRSREVQADFLAAGLLINYPKSVLEPTSRLKLLGFWVDSVEGSFRIPAERKKKVLDHLRVILESPRIRIRARELASTAGRIQSCFLALGPVTRIFTRGMYECIESRSSWRGEVLITPEVRREAAFWLASLEKWDGQAIWELPLLNPRVLHVDASDTGWGGWQEGLDHFDAREWFTASEACGSSTYRELLGLERLLDIIKEEAQGEHALVYTDSLNTQLICQHGSSKRDLNSIAARIFLMCVEYSIYLKVRWVPREENVEADILSKFLTSGDWRLSRVWFEYLNKRWGPHDVDRFATGSNAQLDTFNSKWRCRGSAAVDAFTQHWGGANNWVCPDFRLMERVLNHLRVCHATATLIVPVWDTAPWWGALRPDGQWTPAVRDVVWLPREASVFQAEHEKAMLGCHQHAFDVVAVRVSFAC